MSTPGKAQTAPVDQFFMVTEARFDRWRALLQAGRAWENIMNQEQPNRRARQEAVSNSFRELLQAAVDRTYRRSRCDLLHLRHFGSDLVLQ